MGHGMSRRELLAALGASGLAAAAGAARAGEPAEASAPPSKGDLVTPRGVPATAR